MNRDLEYELTGGPYAVTAARLALSEMDELVDESIAFDVRLLVSELVTNSVRHAQTGPDDSIHLKVSVTEKAVRVEVSDSGQGFDPPETSTTAELARDNGWGLFFVEQLADRWKVEKGTGLVWFEIDQDQEQESDSRNQTAA